MNWEEHCKSSMEHFGEDGAEYHKWLDQYANGPGAHDHRKVLHHQEGVEVGVMLFGERARKHFIQHLIDDGVYENEEEFLLANELYEPGFLPYVVKGVKKQ